MNDFLKLIFSNFGKFLGITLGLIIALCLIFLGFWKTLFIIGIVILGFIIGKLYDEGFSIKKIIKDIIETFRENKWQ
ncbi:MAG: DUF2273 domain-containing protein [Candidatus Goldbacteria bacterium]|nr:DUF2273 domain-containing protein [Candidatus Goldiibacteriota bacterium]